MRSPPGARTDSWHDSVNQEQNKALVLRAFARSLTSATMLQRGSFGLRLFNLIRPLPDTLRCEAGLVIAERDFVIAQGSFPGLEQR